VREALTVNLPACHPLRLLLPTHLLEAGHAIRTLRELLGHEDVPITTLVSTHVLNRGGHAVCGPEEAL
jgi:site-specific recombinase XerD